MMSPCCISSMTTAATVPRERPVRAASCELTQSLARAQLAEHQLPTQFT